MKQEDKDLLLKDLCSRLPYKVNIQVKDWTTLETELKAGHIQRLQSEGLELKPFLRLMSNMTEEEKETYSLFSYARCNDKAFDWLNAHHFDYRGLIGKGLALVAPKGMYSFN